MTAVYIDILTKLTTYMGVGGTYVAPSTYNTAVNCFCDLRSKFRLSDLTYRGEVSDVTLRFEPGSEMFNGSPHPCI